MIYLYVIYIFLLSQGRKENLFLFNIINLIFAQRGTYTEIFKLDL